MNFGTTELPDVRFSYKDDCGIVSLSRRLVSAYHYPLKYAEPIRDKMVKYFIDNGYLISVNEISDKGRDIGITLVDRMTEDNRQYKQVVYSKSAQRMIFAHIPGFKLEVDCDSGGEYHSGDEMVEDMYSLAFGKKISFKRVFASHYFSDEEVQALLRGDEITIPCKTKFGNSFEATGTVKYLQAYNSQDMCYRFSDQEMETNPNWYKVKQERYKQKLMNAPFIGNKKNMLYHTSNCKFAPINLAKRVAFSTKEEAENNNYKACNYCKP